MPLRTLVDATDIHSWSVRRDAQEILPLLLRRLIHATVNRVVRIGFPAGDAVQQGGWDGRVEVAQGNEYVPDGVSVWEMGVNRDPKGKAEDDYRKRIANPFEVAPTAASFIFVTTRRWRAKDKWVTERQAEGIWREVRAYDADDLEQWLGLAPAVHTWFSILLGKHPESAIDLMHFWEDWAGATYPQLHPQLFTGGRQNEVDRLSTWLRGEPAPLPLKADSQNEAIAFFAATLQQRPIEERLPLLSRSLIVTDNAAWNQLVVTDQPLLLIPVFDVGNGVIRAIRNNHHVLIPLGKDSSETAITLVLPRLHREPAKEALLAMGLPEARADDLATVARRSLLALRRRLATLPDVQHPTWAQPAQARPLLAALLAGGWQDTQAGDRDVLAQFARMPYDEFSGILTRWANESDPPVRGVGTTWLLASKEDAWLLLARLLTHDDLERFETTMSEVLGALDPSLDLPRNQQWMAGVFGQIPIHSALLRKELAETVALLGAHTTSFADATTGQDRANRIVQRLLRQANTDWRHWASVSSFLPSLAEAAPNEFLSLVDAGLVGEHPVLMQLFREDNDLFLNRSFHTGLLWAIELLAWSPEYLSRAALLLARLAALDPGGTLANRPSRSLREIFLCWYPQTSASLEQRLHVLDMLRVREPHVAWTLFITLLPTSFQDVSNPTVKPHWRDWGQDEEPKITEAEYWRATHAIAARLLIDAGQDAQRWQDLIKRVADLPKEQFDALIVQLMSIDTTRFPQQEMLNLREALREIIVHHRQYPETVWALPGEAIARLQQIYDRFEPDNLIDRYIWLFSQGSVRMRANGKTWQEREQAVVEAQYDAVKQIYAQGGLTLLFEMVDRVEQPVGLGMSLGIGDVLAGEEDLLLSQYIATEQPTYREMVRGYIIARTRRAGWQWVAERVAGIVQEQFSPEQQALFFIALPFESCTWDLLLTLDTQIQQLYWSKVAPWGTREADWPRAATRFLEHGRPYAAMVVIAPHYTHAQREGTPAFVTDVLEQLVRAAPEPDLDIQLLAYHVSEMLEYIEASGEVSEERIATLEWAFLPIREHQRRGPRMLHRKLADDPLFFVEILALVYRAENEEPQTCSDEDRVRGRVASDLLRTWRLIPGTQPDNAIDYETLRMWIHQARSLAQQLNRSRVGDDAIGTVLSFASLDADTSWPPIAVRNMIEEVASDDLDRGFIRGVGNKRGPTWRGMTEGGAQERSLAETYRRYAQIAQEQWPRTASLLRRIADKYEAEARDEDVRAELNEDLWR